MPETLASTLRDMPRSARMVRTRWPSCSRKPVSGSGSSVMSLFVSLPGQTNFAIGPPIEIPRRFQPFGFDECFDPVGDEVHICSHWLFERFRDVDEYALYGYWHFQSCRDVNDDAGNLGKLRCANCKEGVIDQLGGHLATNGKERVDRKHNASKD